MEGRYIGRQVKAARKLRGIATQKDLAGKIGKARFGDKVIGQIERDERVAQPHEVEWIADAVELAVEYFDEPPAPAADDDSGDKAATPDLSLAKVETSTVDARLKRVEDALQEVRESLEELHGQREGFLELLAAQQKVLEGIAGHLGDRALRNRADKAVAASIKRARAGLKASEARALQAATPDPAAADGTSAPRRKSKA